MNTFTTTLISAMAVMSLTQITAASQAVPAQEAVAARQINVKIGQTQLLELPSNASTGYSWQLEQPLTATSVAAIDITALPAKPNDVVGVPANSLVTITGKLAGTQEYKLVYVRPASKDSAPQKTVTLIITVQ